MDSKKKVLWGVSGLLALTFLTTGISKLAAVPPSPENFARWGLSPTVMYAVGATEVVLALALLIPRVALFSAILLAGTMLGAIYTGITHHEWLHIFLPALLILLLGYVIYARRLALRKTPQT